MEVILYDEDLPEENKMVNTSLTKFEHFNAKAQKVIEIAGKARYVSRDSYNVIYPPKALTN